MKEKIFVTKTSLPPLKEYTKYLKSIWKNNIVTNHGPLSIELEHKLRKYLNVPNLLFVSNGTVALEVAIKALGLEGEIITTPFSYVATTSAIIWTGCKPVFVDIDENSLCIDHKLIEKSITKKTRAIIATHVYGNPCEVEEIEKIAKKHELKVIYDAAHAFGINYKGKTVLNYGDISTLSFHATKLFHTIEGGAVITNNDDNAAKLAYLRNFGHKGQEDFWGLGINGKNSELHAAMGLCMLPHVKGQIKDRKKISDLYSKLLSCKKLKFQYISPDTEYNYAYYPVIFQNEKQLLRVRGALNKVNIYPRRYFYPSLNKLNYVKYKQCRISEKVSESILCLPLYPCLGNMDVERICTIIVENL